MSWLLYRTVERPRMFRIMNTVYLSPATAKLVNEYAMVGRQLNDVVRAEPNGTLKLVVEDWPAYYERIPRFPRLAALWQRLLA
jgi:hypothetical protein